jgi:hypothetical protein
MIKDKCKNKGEVGSLLGPNMLGRGVGDYTKYDI